MIHKLVENISYMLSIDAPAVEIVDELDTPTKMAAADPVKGVIVVKAGMSTFDTAIAVAHELRHIWQYKNEPDMFADYQNSSALSQESYNLQPAEVDANAFAELYVGQYGKRSLWNGLSEEVKTAIHNRAEFIVENEEFG
jgi:hypothetical protein